MSAVSETNQMIRTVLPTSRKKEIFYPESHEDDMGESKKIAGKIKLD